MNKKIILTVGVGVVVFLAGIGASRLVLGPRHHEAPRENLCIDCACKDGGQFCTCANCINIREMQMERQMFRHQHEMMDCPHRKAAEMEAHKKHFEGQKGIEGKQSGRFLGGKPHKPAHHFDGKKQPHEAMPLPEPKREAK